MEIALPDGPATASDLKEIPHVTAALPVVVSDGEEILAFAVFEETEAELFAYTPFDGWYSVNRAGGGNYQELRELWDLLTRDVFAAPIPQGVDAYDEFDEAADAYEDLLGEPNDIP